MRQGLWMMSAFFQALAGPLPARSLPARFGDTLSISFVISSLNLTDPISWKIFVLFTDSTITMNQVYELPIIVKGITYGMPM